MQLPPCGFYKTLAPVAGIPAERLVYFHNHGNPGPGVYLPESWKGNRVQLSKKGNVLPDPPADVRNLEPLPAEGFYRVVEAFHCCDKKCRRFPEELLVQLGYNGEAKAIVFTPELVDGMLAIPERGSAIDADNFQYLKQLKLVTSKTGAASEGEGDFPH